MFNFIFRIIYHIERWIIFWHANNALSSLAYACGLRDRTPHTILSPEKINSYAMNFFQRAECYHLRTNKEIAGCILIELAAFWRRQTELSDDSDKKLAFFLYSDFCEDGAKTILKKEWYAAENPEKSVEEAIEHKLTRLQEDQFEYEDKFEGVLEEDSA